MKNKKQSGCENKGIYSISDKLVSSVDMTYMFQMNYSPSVDMTYVSDELFPLVNMYLNSTELGEHEDIKIDEKETARITCSAVSDPKSEVSILNVTGSEHHGCVRVQLPPADKRHVMPWNCSVSAILPLQNGEVYCHVVFKGDILSRRPRKVNCYIQQIFVSAGNTSRKPQLFLNCVFIFHQVNILII